ncbi:MAG: ComF family protein [Pseudomonadota bacterium]
MSCHALHPPCVSATLSLMAMIEQSKRAVSELSTTVFSALGTTVQRAFSSLCDVLVPPVCLSCENHVSQQGMVCAECWSQLSFLEPPWCAVMGTPFAYDLGEGAQSAYAIAYPPPYDKARAAVIYTDRARHMVQGLKFSDRTDLAPWMAQWMTRVGADVFEDTSVLVPVPLHRGRLWQRRYNQSAELARHVGRLTGLSYQPDWLSRIRPTRQQVGLGRKERVRNVQGAFRVDDAQKLHVKGRHIVLVDDVFTTGATLEACTRALRRGGATRVSCLTFARVAPGED